MHQLQRLHDEFDVANAAAPKFYIALQLFRSNKVAFDTVLDACNLIQQIGRRAFRINKRLVLSQKFVSQLAAAGDFPCLDQREPFPRFAKSAVIIFHAFERTSQRTCRAFRAQAQIDAKE